MINTSQGPKSPEEALVLLKKAKLPGGDLLGIFKQLDGYPEGGEAAKHVVSHPSSYSEKLQRLAKEKSTGRLIGPKSIKDRSDLRQVLRTCGLRSQVRITIRQNQARRLRMLCSMSNLEIEDRYQTGLMAVAFSGEWCSVPRTFTAVLSLPSDEVFLDTESTLFMLVEKIEILSTMIERVKAYRTPTPLSDKVKGILSENPDLFYDRSLFLEVCEERVFSTQQERVDELSANATMEDSLMLFLTNGYREEFLEYYIARFMAALA